MGMPHTNALRCMVMDGIMPEVDGSYAMTKRCGHRRFLEGAVALEHIRDLTQLIYCKARSCRHTFPMQPTPDTFGC